MLQKKQMQFLHEKVSSGKNSKKQSKYYISTQFKLVEIKV